MCYNTRQSREKKELQKWLNVKAALGDVESDLELIYFHANGWSHPIMWMVTQENPDYLVPGMWGIMPSKQKQADYKEYFKNPRTFGDSMPNQKNCSIILFTGILGSQGVASFPWTGFEPHNTKVKVKGKDFKVPFYFSRKDGDPLLLGGIYTQTADERWTFTILTKEATPMFSEIHNDKKRRPVIISEDNLDSWLHQGNDESDVQDLIDDDLWEGELEAHPVSKDLYSRTIDSNRSEIIDKVEYDEVKIDY